MKQLFMACILILLTSFTKVSAKVSPVYHGTIPVCGNGTKYKFLMQPGNATSVHVQSIDPSSLQPDGMFDTIIAVTPNVDFNILVPYSLSAHTTIWVTWSDLTTNISSTNNLPCGLLALFIVPDSVTRSNRKEMQLVGISPNPIIDNSYLTITTSKKDKVQLSIYTSDGRAVNTSIALLKSGSNRIPLNLSGLPLGIYFIRGVFSDGQYNTLRFIRQ